MLPSCSASYLVGVLLLLVFTSNAFQTPLATRRPFRPTATTTTPTTAHISQQRGSNNYPKQQQQSSNTALHVFLDVPDGFFTVTFAGLGLLLSIAKNFARIRMEENAWEQRLAEARIERLRRDPSLTELDLRRQEAAVEWSAYGKPRMEEEERQRRQQQQEESQQQRGPRRRVKVMDREDGEYNNDYDDERAPKRSSRMSDREIEAFEVEFGVDYDPYYDDPYTEDELPKGNFKEDKFYGDRTYGNGETFFKDKPSGLYYRQGAKPRSLSFFS